MPEAASLITIRRAGLDDAATVMACLALAFEPYRESYTPGAFQDTVLTHEAAETRLREMTVLVAEDEAGNIVGTIAHHITRPGEGHIRGMAVEPQLHGRGIAERLLSAAEMELHDAGCSLVTLDTTRLLQRAIRFYTRHGYESTGVVADFYGMELLEYAKKLG